MNKPLAFVVTVLAICALLLAIGGCTGAELGAGVGTALSAVAGYFMYKSPAGPIAAPGTIQDVPTPAWIQLLIALATVYTAAKGKAVTESVVNKRRERKNES